MYRSRNHSPSNLGIMICVAAFFLVIALLFYQGITSQNTSLVTASDYDIIHACTSNSAVDFRVFNTSGLIECLNENGFEIRRKEQ